jgi:predicted NBD/HSP70 family sugar kinase
MQKRDAGRKAVLLRTNPFGGFFASLLFRKGKIKLEVFDLERRLDASYSVPITKSVVTGDFLINCIEDAVQYNYKYGTFFGIILILPPWHDNAYSDERMREEFGYCFAHDYKEKLHSFYKDIAIFTEPTTAMMAYSSLYGERPSKNVLCIEAGKDIFASFILNGKLFDRRHCTEKLANSIVNYNFIDSGKARLRDYISEFAIRSLYEERTGKSLSFREIANLFKSGDKTATSIIKETGDMLAQCIAGLAQLLELEEIVIGGDLALLGKRFIDGVHDKILSIEPSLRNVRASICVDCATSTSGGAHFAFDHLFDE